MAAAIVARPIETTVAIRTPASTTGSASGSSTNHKRCRFVMPSPVADSMTAGSTEAIPACVFRRMGRSA